MHSFRQYLLISFITQIGDKSTLFGSQHITRTANVQILHGNMNTTTQITEILDRLQATFGFGG